MTREQLDAIRARLTFEYGPHTDVREILHAARDLHALLAEVEGMRESCTGLVKQNERQYDEVLRLTAERDAFMALDASYREQINEAALRTNQAFSRGVAAMREAAVAVARKRADLPKHSDLDSAWCRSAECILDELRHLPDPEGFVDLSEGGKK